MSEKSKKIITQALNLTAEAILEKGETLDWCLGESLSCYGVTRSVMVAFEHGASLRSSFMYDLLKNGIEEDDAWKDDSSIVRGLMGGIKKTVRVAIRSSRVHPIVRSDNTHAKNRILEALLVFNRLCPRLSKDMKTKIFSSDPELAEDVLQVFLAHNEILFDRTDPFAYLRPLFSQKVLEYRALVGLLKAYKMNRLAELLLYKNDEGETPIAYYKKMISEWKTIHGQTFQEQELESLPLFDPNKLEENFGAAIEESIRSLLSAKEAPETIKSVTL